MANDFGTAKSVFILAIVAGCFAILWPNVFYPMITGNYEQKSESISSGCCDVIFDKDINGIKIMTELCQNILNGQSTNNRTIISFTQGQLSKSIIELCKKTVFDKCSLDITELLSRNSVLGKDYKHSLELLRTINSSICLRESFGVSLGQIGLPRRIRIWGLNVSKHMKPERPAHLHPEMMHPALREKGRAIQQSQKIPPEARAGAIPGMRPTLGGAGHVVPPPKGGGTMGIVMPMYTIGIVIFFLYTMLKLMFKKSGEVRSYEEFNSDADFQRDVFGLNQDYVKEKAVGDSRLVTSAFTGLLQEVNKQISEQIQTKSDDKEATNESQENTGPTVEDDLSHENENEKNISEIVEKTETLETKTGVKVIGMETTESCEGGKWNRPETPRPPTPQNIYIPAVLPDQSKIMVTNSSTETIPSSEDNAPVVLSGKVTLSLIGIRNSDDVDYETSSEKLPFGNNEDIETDSNEKQSESEILDTSTAADDQRKSEDLPDMDSSMNLGKKIEQSSLNTNDNSSLVTNG